MPKPRGQSTAAKKAAVYFAQHPTSTAEEIAKRFGLDVSTVYRSAWWKNRVAAQPAGRAE